MSTKETAILHEVECCLAHFHFFVVPRFSKLPKGFSIWSEANPAKYVGIVYRSNTGAAEIGKRFIRFGMPGLPDFQGWLFDGGKRVSIEVKADNGKLTHDQRAHLDLALKTGNLAGCVRSYRDCEILLKGYGLKRGN